MVADQTDYAVGVGKTRFIVSSVNGTLVKKMSEPAIRPFFTSTRTCSACMIWISVTARLFLIRSA